MLMRYKAFMKEGKRRGQPSMFAPYDNRRNDKLLIFKLTLCSSEQECALSDLPYEFNMIIVVSGSRALGRCVLTEY
ncbi:hypothetical protein TNCT_562671 [Trichonephila clavata]|uniref:Uncharacterized protein n=1 Tax=Trichonephila clavata TaxID=2740835 RepID=A0A8X6GV60_TRICU|nr:hypothetical protein TNCT_562671 [Trichonephila clavata]